MILMKPLTALQITCEVNMLLLDTHVLLWYLRDSMELPKQLNDTISKAADVATSAICLWELAIKASIKKLELEFSLAQIEDLCIEKGIKILPLRTVDMDIIKTLPDIHKDPFDRMLVCQAINNAAIIITKDDNIARYPVRTLWV